MSELSCSLSGNYPLVELCPVMAEHGLEQKKAEMKVNGSSRGCFELARVVHRLCTALQNRKRDIGALSSISDRC